MVGLTAPAAEAGLAGTTLANKVPTTAAMDNGLMNEVMMIPDMIGEW
ncbi:hypothetical protein [Janthinobacterium sp. NKUCC08_JDC]|nr:hypothetical protein [Janthinobacterium sp. NKUCC08_JDC]